MPHDAYCSGHFAETQTRMALHTHTHTHTDTDSETDTDQVIQRHHSYRPGLGRKRITLNYKLRRERD